jgi:hypothetical protein
MNLSMACAGRFELVEAGRKVLLISVLSVVNADADSYLWTAFLVSFAMQILFAICQPYEQQQVDRIQNCSLIVTCLTMYELSAHMLIIFIKTFGEISADFMASCFKAAQAS